MRSAVVRDVAECLLVAEEVVAVADLLLVGTEADQARGAVLRRARDERRDLLDLLRAQLAAEGRHPAAAVRNLANHAVVVGLQLVEVRPDLALRLRGAERVAGAAAGAREHLPAPRRQARASAAARDPERDQ